MTAGMTKEEIAREKWKLDMSEKYLDEILTPKSSGAAAPREIADAEASAIKKQDYTFQILISLLLLSIGLGMIFKSVGVGITAFGSILLLLSIVSWIAEGLS